MSIAENYLAIQSSLPKEVTLVVVSKTHTVEKIMEVYNTGHRIFGENKVQEMEEKYYQMPKDIQWHLIGHLQTNKVKFIAPFVHLIHSVDSLKLLQEINKQALKNNRIIKCLLQIYIADVVFDSTGAVSGIGQPLAVTNDGAVNWAPYFSPNGKVIVYASSRVGHDNYEILAVPVPSDRDAPLGQPRRVTYADGADLLPAISPDGKLLMWTSQRGPGRSSQLWLADMSQQDLLLGELVAPAAEKSPTSSATTPSAIAPNNSATTPTAQPK